ncbi:hypothetical protein [Nitrospira sp. M1]
MIEGAEESRRAPALSFATDGFAIVEVFSEMEVQRLKQFAKHWVYSLLGKRVSNDESTYPLETYHVWGEELRIEHEKIFCAKNRYRNPKDEIRGILLNARVNDYLDSIGVRSYTLCDDGKGWCGFRFIRPRKGDGYPLSRKSWGPAGNVISCWVPIIGLSTMETLGLVPGSHLKDYSKYLPKNEKFCSGEYRADLTFAPEELYHPSLEMGEVLWYHPDTLHTEEIIGGDVARLSLEFRVA